MPRRITKTAEQMLQEFGYQDHLGGLWFWREFRVRVYPDGSWSGWSTECDPTRKGKSTTTLKRYLELMHT